MPGLLSDVNLDGHLRLMRSILEGDGYRELWGTVRGSFCSFADLGLDRQLHDDVQWTRCQGLGQILITANRNREDPSSLEATIRERGSSTSLPILTLSVAGRFLRDRVHAHRVVDRPLDHLIDLEDFRGAGRLYLP